jgi:hypothetical protein
MLSLVTRIAILCALLALVLAPAALADRGDDGAGDARGVVQTVTPRTLELRTLDGATLVVRTDARTRVTVNKRRAALTDIGRGFVAVVHVDDRGVARDVQAFGNVQPGSAKSSGKPDDSSKSGKGKGPRRGDDTR